MSRSNHRWLLVIGLLLLSNVILFLSNITLGERTIPAMEAIQTAFGLGSSEYSFTIQKLRMPRVLVGFLVGCSLALSGTILQGVTRNPLASPGVIGLNAGAAAAVVAVIVLLPSIPSSKLPFVAFGGALLAAVFIYIFSWRRGSSPTRMLLVGIGISAMAGAVVTYLLTLGGIFKVTQASIWMAGSLYSRSWEHFWPLLPWLLILFPISLYYARQLDLIQLGDEMAKALGLRLELSRLLLILVSVGLAGSAVSMAGTIAFVGLMAPHMARHLVGNRNRKLLPTAALMGGAIVMLADLLGRMLFKPYEIPVGIITALVGAPYMIYVLYRKKHI
ncbi:FecCD family ABC transporter permease [Paenibacillus luteus]|uniref:FecCD family ABC transporter permease n=1 Tax=Paenibacillus luteus TaxID=2545753 RepID=UPI00114515DF|nr:iron ABC transporter permease [Paenibacillus luteus]